MSCGDCISLTELVQIFKKEVLRDDYGGEDIRYSLFATQMAKTEKGKGSDSEKEINKRNTALRDVYFIIRYREDLQTDMYIKYKDELGENNYNIIVINEYQKYGRKKYLILTTIQANTNFKINEVVPSENALLAEDLTPLALDQNDNILILY